jgi:hypothetical protein
VVDRPVGVGKVLVTEDERPPVETGILRCHRADVPSLHTYTLGPDSVNISVCTIIGSHEQESLACGHAHA